MIQFSTELVNTLGGKEMISRQMLIAVFVTVMLLVASMLTVLSVGLFDDSNDDYSKANALSLHFSR